MGSAAPRCCDGIQNVPASVYSSSSNLMHGWHPKSMLGLDSVPIAGNALQLLAPKDFPSDDSKDCPSPEWW